MTRYRERVKGMSKNHVPSARSGRKGNEKKDQLDMRITIAVTAVIVLALLCAFFVPRIVRDRRDGVLGVDHSGMVKGIQDHWLVADIGEGTNRRYIHLADIEPMEGYAIKGTGYLTDPNVRSVYFEGEGPEYSAVTAKGAYDRMAEDFRGNQDILLTQVLELGDVTEGQAGTWRTAAFWVNGTIDDMYDQDGNPVEPGVDDEGNAVYPQKYEQAAYCYVESPREGVSVLLSMVLFDREENAFMEPERMLEILMEAAGRIEYR